MARSPPTPIPSSAKIPLSARLEPPWPLDHDFHHQHDRAPCLWGIHDSSLWSVRSRPLQSPSTSSHLLDHTHPLGSSLGSDVMIRRCRLSSQPYTDAAIRVHYRARRHSLAKRPKPRDPQVGSETVSSSFTVATKASLNLSLTLVRGICWVELVHVRVKG